MKSGYQLGQEKKGILGGSQELFCILNVIESYFFNNCVYTLSQDNCNLHTQTKKRNEKQPYTLPVHRPWAWNVNVPHKWHWSIF